MALINPTHSLNTVWQVETLSWVAMVQPFSSGPLTATITNDGTFARETGGNLATLVARAPALVSGRTPVDPSGVTSPVSLAALPNPSNLDVALSTRLKAADTLAGVTAVGSITNPVAVTNANLDSPLSGLKTDLDRIPAQGQALSAASMPVVLPAAQITTLTPPTTVAVTQGGPLSVASTIKDASAATAATVQTLTTPVAGATTALVVKADVASIGGTGVIATGNGASAAGTQRVSEASDSALSTSAATIATAVVATQPRLVKALVTDETDLTDYTPAATSTLTQTKDGELRVSSHDMDDVRGLLEAVLHEIRTQRLEARIATGFGLN